MLRTFTPDPLRITVECTVECPTKTFDPDEIGRRVARLIRALTVTEIVLKPGRANVLLRVPTDTTRQAVEERARAILRGEQH